MHSLHRLQEEETDLESLELVETGGARSAGGSDADPPPAASYGRQPGFRMVKSAAGIAPYRRWRPFLRGNPGTRH